MKVAELHDTLGVWYRAIEKIKEAEELAESIIGNDMSPSIEQALGLISIPSKPDPKATIILEKQAYENRLNISRLLRDKASMGQAALETFEYRMHSEYILGIDFWLSDPGNEGRLFRVCLPGTVNDITKDGKMVRPDPETKLFIAFENFRGKTGFYCPTPKDLVAVVHNYVNAPGNADLERKYFEL